MLLGDWVFKDSPIATRKVADCMFDDLGLKGAAVGFVAQGMDEPTSLPEQCGREEIGRRIIDVFDRDVDGPSRGELTRLLSANWTSDFQSEIVSRIRANGGTTRTAWIGIGASCGVMDSLGDELRVELFTGDTPTNDEIATRGAELLLGRAHVAEQISVVVDAIVSRALYGGGSVVAFGNGSWLLRFSRLCSISFATYQIVGHGYPQLSRLSTNENDRQADFGPSSLPNIVAFLKGTADLDSISSNAWMVGLRPWNFLVESLTQSFGKTWAAYGISAVAAGIRSRGERGIASQLFDASVPLCERARYARLRRGGPAWWLEQLAKAEDQFDRMYWVLLTLRWGSEGVLRGLLPKIEELLTALDADEYALLFSTLYQSMSVDRVDSRRRPGMVVDHSWSVRLSALVALRGSGTYTRKILSQLEGIEDKAIADLASRMKLASMTTSTRAGSSERLAAVRDFYERFGGVAGVYGRRGLAADIGPEAAESVLSDPLSYPHDLVLACESVFRRNAKTVSIAEVAKTKGWTFE